MEKIKTGLTIIDSLIADGLSRYLLERGGGIKLEVYRDPSLITEKITSDVFLVEGGLLDERLLSLLSGRVFALGPGADDETVETLDRFTPADELMGKVFRILLQENVMITGVRNPLHNKELTVFFSPHAYEFLGAAAREYCRLSAGKKRVLLLDLRPYSEDVSGDCDLGDLIYYLRTREMSASALLTCCGKERDGYSCVPPFKEPRDTEDLNENDISLLLNRLMDETDHDRLVMVMPDRAFGIDTLLTQCTGFYMVNRTGGIYGKLAKRFMDSIEKEMSDTVRELIIDDPVHSDVMKGSVESLSAYLIKNTDAV